MKSNGLTALGLPKLSHTGHQFGMNNQLLKESVVQPPHSTKRPMCISYDGVFFIIKTENWIKMAKLFHINVFKQTVIHSSLNQHRLITQS